MEEVNNIKVSIPKPCQENWNNMTPNEQGAFCKMCAKPVIDFTQKSVQELKQYLMDRKNEKICGRVNSDQLDVFSHKTIALNIPLNIIPNRLSLNNAFAIALFITFGTTLFSCNTQQGELVGKIATVVDSSQNKDPLTKEKAVFLVDTVKIKKGEIKSNKIPKKSCMPLKGDIAVENPLGEMKSETVNSVNGGLAVKIDTIEKLPIVGKMKIKE